MNNETKDLPASQKDVEFLKELNGVFGKKEFSAQIYPNEAGDIRKAILSTTKPGYKDLLEKLVTISGKWKLHLRIGEKGDELKIKFYTK